jgi:tetratricopeptide (TPR) repeat protein
MENKIHPTTPVTAGREAAWPAWQVYAMAAFCLALGLIFGYIARGSAPAVSSAATIPAAMTAGPITSADAPRQMPTLDDMRRMADKQVEPLLEKLNADSDNPDLLNQVATVYRMTHQFDTAATYYQKVLQVNPKNVGARTDLASCLFYQGDADGAIAQLEKSLTYDPKHAGTLLNLGVIRWKGKNDAAGAIATWQKLLQYYPNFENRQQVEKLIADAKAHPSKALPVSQ